MVDRREFLKQTGAATTLSMIGHDSAYLKPCEITDTDPEAPGQLYDLSIDPQEKRNLYNKYAEVVTQLTRQLEHFQSSGRSAPLHR